MGFFSSKKQSSSSTDIPADILADVSVNGEKRPVVAPSSAAISSPSEKLSSSSSPFLKSKPAVVPAETIPTPPVAPVVPEATPKTFQFSDQTPLAGEIHFTEATSASVPAPASAPEKVPEQPATPVDTRPDFSQIAQDKALLERHKEHLSPLKAPLTPPSPQKPFWSSRNIVLALASLLILIFIAGGSWYYLHTRSSVSEVPEPSIGAMPPMVTPPQSQETKSTILIDQPNYLPIDVETVTVAQIKELLEKEGQKMKAEGVAVPVEYLVVDTNSNPVAFARFAFLIGADTPNDLVKAALEPFSLYLFLDQGELRIALAIPLTPETSPNFPSNKSVLPESLKKFFYSEEYGTFNFSSLSFSQVNYKNSTIWYTNLDVAKNLSLDMVMQEGILTVANSKATLRAVIDKRLLVPEQ